jgi:hypothetical protein
VLSIGRDGRLSTERGQAVWRRHTTSSRFVIRTHGDGVSAGGENRKPLHRRVRRRHDVDRHAVRGAHAAGDLLSIRDVAAMQANLFDTHEPPPATPTPAMVSFYRTMRTLGLDVTTIAPVHGKPVPMSTFMTALGAAASECPVPGPGGSVVWGRCP